jgi:hypothetical protein
MALRHRRGDRRAWRRDVALGLALLAAFASAAFNSGVPRQRRAFVGNRSTTDASANATRRQRPAAKSRAAPLKDFSSAAISAPRKRAAAPISRTPVKG